MTTALLLVDHGSVLSEANETLHQMVALVQERRPHMLVEGAHMDLARPTIAEAISSCLDRGATTIVVHPYMLSPGKHASKDIPQIIEKAAAMYPHVCFRVTEPLGVHKGICDAVLERAGL